MGLQIKDLITSKEIDINHLINKIVVVDGFNLLYQFLTTIRQRDGTPLTDSKGNVTSHLIGLFSRTSNLLSKGVKLAFVFDGKPPALKEKERARRREVKLAAQKKYEVAKQQEDIAGMKKFASQTTRLTPIMVEEAKKLIVAFGCPVIQAPSEGEAQAAYIVKQSGAYATISQDFDTLLYQTPRLIRNLSIAGKRKRTGKLGFTTIKPEEIMLAENLNKLGLDIDQMIALSMLVGTDYNIGGIKGIGPKKATILVKKFGKEFDEMFKEVKWDESFDIPWTDVYYQFKNMPVTDDYELVWKDVDVEALKKLLVDEHDFSNERIDSAVKKFAKKEQKGLSEFF
jgi:flap endonuclease-1